MSKRSPLEQLSQPTYEEELRAMAYWIRRKASGVVGIPAFCVQMHPDIATWIADRLDNYADDVEKNRG